jgi:hypothetical protein
VISYVALAVDASWHRPRCAVPGNTLALFVVSLVLLGLIMYLLLRQVGATISREW